MVTDPPYSGDPEIDTEASRDVVEQWIDKALNHHDPTAIGALAAPHLLIHPTAMPCEASYHGPAGATAWLQAQWDSFEDPPSPTITLFRTVTSSQCAGRREAPPAARSWAYLLPTEPSSSRASRCTASNTARWPRSGTPATPSASFTSSTPNWAPADTTTDVDGSRQARSHQAGELGAYLDNPDPPTKSEPMTRHDVTDETLIEASPEVVYDAIVHEMDGKTCGCPKLGPRR